MKKRVLNINYDYLFIFLNKLHQSGIIRFSKKQLEKNLYFYKNNPKYSILFNDYCIKEERLDLTEAFMTKNIKQAIISMDYDLDIKYIVNEIQVMKSYDLEIINLIESLVEEYIIDENQNIGGYNLIIAEEKVEVIESFRKVKTKIK